MKSKKVARIAQDEIPPIVAKNPSLVADLLDAAYCERKFGISAPLLSTRQVYFPGGDAIYYAKPRVSAGGKKYFLYMHWYKERHLKHLLDWIFANR